MESAITSNAFSRGKDTRENPQKNNTVNIIIV